MDNFIKMSSDSNGSSGDLFAYLWSSESETETTEENGTGMMWIMILLVILIIIYFSTSSKSSSYQSIPQRIAEFGRNIRSLRKI